MNIARSSKENEHDVKQFPSSAIQKKTDKKFILAIYCSMIYQANGSQQYLLPTGRKW